MLYTAYAIKKYTRILHDYSKKRKIEKKYTHFWTSKQLFAKNKKMNNKSRSLLALNAHPVNLILSVSQLAAWLEVSLSFFPFCFLCISTYFYFKFTTKFGVVDHKVSEIHSTTSRSFNYIYLNC